MLWWLDIVLKRIFEGVIFLVYVLLSFCFIVWNILFNLLVFCLVKCVVIDCWMIKLMIVRYKNIVMLISIVILNVREFGCFSLFVIIIYIYFIVYFFDSLN